MIQHFSLLQHHDLKSLLPDVTLILFPIGGMEQHGPHLPFGTKLIESKVSVDLLTQKLQEKMPAWNFIIMPMLPFTVDTHTTSIALSVRPHVMRDALVDQCEALKKLGFNQFAAYSSHLTPRQLSAIEDASKIVSRGRKTTLVSLSSSMVELGQVLKSPMISLPEEHGGAWDTAMVMSQHPELVQSEMTQSLSNVEPPKASVSRFFQYFKGEIDGYWGNPSSANLENMNLKLNRDLDLLVEKLKPVLEQGRGKSEFFSSYRRFPMNGSFFKAYLLASVFFMSIIVWILWGVKNVFE